MAKKEIKRVSINKLESAISKEGNIVVETLKGTNDVTFEIMKTIPLSEMIAFVQEVVEACVDSETCEYVAEAYDFALRVGVLTHYANFAMPKDIETRYMLVYGTSAFEQVVQLINRTQFTAIVKAIDKKIAYMLDVITSTAASKIGEVISKFNDIAEIGEKAFGGAEAEEMAKVMKNIAKIKDMKEEDIAKAILQSEDSSETKYGSDYKIVSDTITADPIVVTKEHKNG